MSERPLPQCSSVPVLLYISRLDGFPRLTNNTESDLGNPWLLGTYPWSENLCCSRIEGNGFMDAFKTCTPQNTACIHTNWQCSWRISWHQLLNKDTTKQGAAYQQLCHHHSWSVFAIDIFISFLISFTVNHVNCFLCVLILCTFHFHVVTAVCQLFINWYVMLCQSVHQIWSA